MITVAPMTSNLRSLSRAFAALLLVTSLLPLPAAAQAEGASADDSGAATSAPGVSAPPTPTAPAAAPKKIAVPVAAKPSGEKVTGSFWSYSEDKINNLKIAFALIVVGLFLWGFALDARGQGRRLLRVRRSLLAFFGIVAVAGWFNFGKFHGGIFVHVWEHYHYYIGAKYVPELQYARLYECSAIAEVELRGEAKVRARKLRDLADTNLIRSTDDVLANPDRCKQHFTPARWNDFKADIQFFMRRMGDSQWERSQKDHGYNGTPWWGIAGTALANLIGPASADAMNTLGLIDPILLLAMFAAIWWAFGLETFTVAAVFFSVNFPSRYWWNGGAFLRYDYLAAALIGVALLKKGRPILGGAALAFAAASRLFPLFFIVGPVLQAGWRLFKDRKLPAEHRGILIGGVLATAFLVPASLLVAKSDLEFYENFTHNTLKHSDTPLTNHMGMRTLLSWRPTENAKQLKNSRDEDPFKRWKESRLENYRELRWLFVLLNLAFLAAIWRSTRDEPAWVAAALSGTLMVTSATELTCYYYGFLMAGAFLMEKRKEFGLWLILLGIGTHAIVKFPSWDDEKYVWMSLLSLLYGVMIVVTLLTPEKARTAAAEPAPAGGKRP